MTDLPPTETNIDPKALDPLSIAPLRPDTAANDDDAERPEACDPRQQAGQDETIAARLARDPSCANAKLDVALDESMDASDPPAQTAPGGSTDPAPSSGYDADAEALRRK